jgi:hypothetical protein
MALKVHLRSQDEVVMMKEEHEGDFDQDNSALLLNKERIWMHNNQY